LLAVFICVYGVVLVLEVPIAQESHHHPQPVKFACAHKWIVPPVPVGFLFLITMVSLKASSIKMSGRNYVALPTMEMSGKVVHRQIRDVIVLIREIADGPQQPGCHHFRLCLNSQFDFPLCPVRILDFELGILSVLIFLQKLYRQPRTMLFTTGTIQQIL
jgi:hypothetical protein